MAVAIQTFTLTSIFFSLFYSLLKIAKIYVHWMCNSLQLGLEEEIHLEFVFKLGAFLEPAEDSYLPHIQRHYNTEVP